MVLGWGKRFWPWVVAILLLNFGLWIGIGLLRPISRSALRAPSGPQWHLTGELADGFSQQYVDLNSLRAGGNPQSNQWIVDSYFATSQDNEVVRADYVTLYDCDRNLYQDLNADGLPTGDWGDAMADPLNLATMDYVCQQLVDEG